MEEDMFLVSDQDKVPETEHCALAVMEESAKV